jgi:formylglycine-generating enzyme required for sulfatase activity
MKKLVWLGCTAVAAMFGRVEGDAGPELDIHLYAGVNVTGAISNVYVVQATSELGQSNPWRSLAFVQLTRTNQLFIDTSRPAAGHDRRMYRAHLQPTPTNMVFIPANTFLMGSPVTESNRNTNEGPQTLVTLSRGFWIGRYEVTQGEYLAVTGTNPSEFPGDLNRPISSVSWTDATNYCSLLTERELAAGRISAGSRYRLPTEAEWEYAARAGTATRYSFGDDPENTELERYAWTARNAGFTVHPVGEKLPNPWGLYDTYGNVWEWTQDWLGPLSGGAVTDPQGPETNPIGWKVTRGGSFDQGDYRSATRYFYGNHPALKDWNLGFRVVLVTDADSGPQ